MIKPDILFTNAYHISADRHEQITMRPYPALGPLYIAASLRRHQYQVAFFDSVFETNEEEFAATMQRLDPAFVGVSALVIGRDTAREQIRLAKAQGRTVIAGGPDPSIVPGIYLRYGADYVVVGEGEETALELMDALTGRRRASDRGDPGHCLPQGWRAQIRQGTRPDQRSGQPALAGS